MNIQVFNYYIESMKRIEAHEVLLQMKVGDYPNMKQDARGRLHRKMYMTAYPANGETNKPLTTEQVFGLLKGI
jgi:hypothetical protein